MLSTKKSNVMGGYRQGVVYQKMSDLDWICNQFSLNLPSVGREYAHSFAQGMVKYFETYKVYRDGSMNCELDCDYLSECAWIMESTEQVFWQYSPHFKKIVARTIEHLFKTEIVGMGGRAVIVNNTMLFVDKPGNRWSFEIVQEQDGTFKLLAKLPRFQTLFGNLRVLTNEELDLQGRAASNVMLVEDTSCWRLD